jgi:preprotein translocase subunit SecA
MKTHILPVPGIVLGMYPERPTQQARPAPRGLAWWRGWPAVQRKPSRYARFVERVQALDAKAGPLGREEIAAALACKRAAMARHGMTDELIADAFVLIKRTCERELGLELFAAQLFAARAMLDQRLAEMATGEGKTLAAAVCAATAALAGIPVHVVTANDYLVARDAGYLQPLYRALGLRAAAVTQDLAHDRRREAYRCDIVYCTASELVFDYLRDGLARDACRSDLQQRVATLDGAAAHGGTDRGPLLRGLCMAVVDEADSILLDDARVPLILSKRDASDAESGYHAVALDHARQLAAEEHFVLDRSAMSARLTAAGGRALEACAAGLSGAWHNRAHRDETVCTALAALHLFEKDRHYLVQDGAVTIIDESTGRLAPGRVWSRGLHRLIELKEACAGAGATVTVAQITFQRFFQRYLALCGMSGTLAEARGELYSTYGLALVTVPLSRPDRRQVLPTRLYRDRESQWRAVLAEAGRISRAGRAVLVGTDSVAESEALSARLTQESLPHAVLNARQDSAEALVVAHAGAAGQITVATNMAGRGTDIVLGAGVAGRGGLHVISCQHNASQRIDRQLLGRCARRGEPGSAQTLLALDQPLLARWTPAWLAPWIGPQGVQSPQWLVHLVVTVPQRLAENRARAQRRDLLRRDQRAQRSLSFGRPME